MTLLWDRTQNTQEPSKRKLKCLIQKEPEKRCRLTCYRFQSETDETVLMSAYINTISSNTIPSRPGLWKVATISEPARAPDRKLVHIGANTWMAVPVECLAESGSGPRAERKCWKL